MHPHKQTPLIPPLTFTGTWRRRIPTSLLCLYLKPRCYIKSPTVWRSRQYSKHNGVGWGRFCSVSCLDWFVSHPYSYTQNPSSMIKQGLNVTYHKPTSPSQVKTLAEVPEEVPVCSSRYFPFVRLYLAYVQCGIKSQFYQRGDWRIHQWTHFAWTAFFLASEWSHTLHTAPHVSVR